ncbi:MAG: sigma-70 family RNA polymerase sigma factor [Acidobacteriota bacterium]
MISAPAGTGAERASHHERSGERERWQEFEQIQRSLGSQLLAFFAVPQRRISGLEPEDLAQMTLVRVYRGMDRFRREAGIRTWVLKIAVNVWANALRDREAAKRAASEEVSLDSRSDRSPGEAPIQLRDPADNPQQKLLAEERTRLLQEAISTLPPKMSRCVLLRNRDQLSIREIATLLQIEDSTVKSHLREGKRRLGRLLRERFGISDSEKATP